MKIIFTLHIRLGAVGTFVYFGTTLSRDESLVAEKNTRIQKSSDTFCRLEERLWSEMVVTFQTRATLYQTFKAF